MKKAARLRERLKGQNEVKRQGLVRAVRVCPSTFFQPSFIMPNSVVPLHPHDADEHSRAETERKQRLFEWADRVLADLGLADKVRNANTADDLRRVTFDHANPSAVDLAIREALHPAIGSKRAYFAGMNEGMLKRVLTMRFKERKKERVTGANMF